MPDETPKKSAKKRPAWLTDAQPTEAQPADAGPTRREAGFEESTAAQRTAQSPGEKQPSHAGPDPAEAPTIDLSSPGSAGHGPYARDRGSYPAQVLSRSPKEAGEAIGGAVRGTATARSAGASGGGGGASGILDQLRSTVGNLLPSFGLRTLLLAALIVVAAVSILIGLRVLPGVGPSEEDAAKSASADGPDRATPGTPSPAIVDTGAVFGALNTHGAAATLEGAGLAWEGTVDAGEAGETITLTGPTAAQIRRGFRMPRSSIDSGVYAVAPQGGRVLHVTYHTFSAGQTEVTQGSIFGVEDDRLDYAGFYRDERKKGSDTVVRTYMPPGGDNYRRRFEAPQGTPVPFLVGFEGEGS